MSEDTEVIGAHGRIEPVDLQTEMQRSYLEYSMSVIVSRALPDVRDGLKPVHRRVLYAMYDGGYRPDRNFSKSARVVGDVMGSYHPHGDSAIYDALVRLAQPWSLRYPLVQGQGNFGSPGNDPPAAQRYTECRMAPLAMEMVRDIDEETVDFGPNYDGRTQEPLVLPARFPNLLVNGSAGIAVGMATNIPPHNLREVAAGAQWLLANPDADREARQEALLGIITGPDFPTGALIVGRRGIEDAYRTGRGSITMRAVVTVEEDARGRQILIVTELPYQVNPDNLLLRIAELVGDGKLTGISDVRDDSSSRTGMRLVIELKRDAVAQVVLNQLFKHTQLQDNFGANMLALVDGVPRTLTLEQFIWHWITHQIEVIQRRTRYRLRKAEERAHILRGYLKALDALDEVIALIRASATVDDARTGLMALLDIDEVQSTAILDMQLRRLAALEHQKIVDEYEDLMTRIADYNDILTNEPRQRSIVSEELAEITAKYGDERRTAVVAWDGDVTDEDLIAVEDVVLTITSGGYAKRTKADLYREQRRGGKGVKGAQLRQDDVVEHMFVTTTHHWLLFFTNKGRVYRAKAYQLPEAGRDARGQHVANLLAFQPDETIAQVLAIEHYEAGDHLVLATRTGMVKKTRLGDYDTNRTGGIIAINLADDDEVISAQLVSDRDHVILFSRRGMSARFDAKDETLRPMGRATSGVIGMRFRGDDALLGMEVVREGSFVVTITDGGYAKRTSVDEWAAKGRGILGVRAMKLVEERGSLVGALVCDEGDQIFAIASNGVVIRTSVDQIRPSGRDTMGVRLMNLAEGDAIVAVARGGEADDEGDDDLDAAEADPSAEAAVADVQEPGEATAE
ncbi:MAG: DNA gyrase subunit A [Candidatus Nanopelagicales bacterium]|nr:DNA gyrase subunit A [Candidatus Nanopelagicales bacterium]